MGTSWVVSEYSYKWTNGNGRSREWMENAYVHFLTIERLIYIQK